MLQRSLSLSKVYINLRFVSEQLGPGQDIGTGFMHEAFDQDDPTHFTHAWFAWANSLFGELILDLHQRRPALVACSIRGATG